MTQHSRRSRHNEIFWAICFQIKYTTVIVLEYSAMDNKRQILTEYNLKNLKKVSITWWNIWNDLHQRLKKNNKIMFWQASNAYWNQLIVQLIFLLRSLNWLLITLVNTLVLLIVLLWACLLGQHRRKSWTVCLKFNLMVSELQNSFLRNLTFEITCKPSA